MKNVLMFVLVLTFFAGCVATKQAIDDYKTGKNTALVNGEISPKDQAAPIANVVSDLPIPFAAAAAPIVLFLATGFFTWKRGSEIRKNNGLVPPTSIAHTNAFTGILQDVANIFAGAFSVASNTDPSTAGSVVQRVWKTALAVLAAGATTGAANTDFMHFLAAHPVLDGTFVAGSAAVMGLEKWLSSLQPTVPAVPAAPVTGVAQSA
jgi:hypothetical protein